jgi:hypothetical protein
MKKHLLFALLSLSSTFILSSCDERIAPLSATNTTPVTPTVSKTELISRQWSFSQIYMEVDAKVTPISGTGTPASIAANVYSSPNNSFTFGKDGKLEAYTEDKKGVKKTETGTWKFSSDEKQVRLLYGAYDFTFDIISLTDKATELLTPKIIVANLASANDTSKQIILAGALAGLVDEKSKEVKYGLKLSAK